MTTDCEIRDLAPQPALVMRTRAPVQGLPEVPGKAYGTIGQYLAMVGEHPAGPPFVGYHNMDMNDLDIEIGIPTARVLPGNDEIRPTHLPGGKVGICIHIGPYSEVGPVYETLTRMVQEKGYRPTGLAYEIYLNDPAETPAAELQTQVLLPLDEASQAG